ncbi:MAG: cytochrome c oxidase assembly protein [Betaproteobacteria bacterium]|nr:cytochrome c oxidase assembly protein [Betaproteobacteria bacterium]
MNRSAIADANRQTLRRLLAVSALMFGFGFALVPFYDKICEVSGARNVFKPDQAPPANTQVDQSRRVTVEFDANTQRLAWSFRPLEAHVAIHPGALTEVVYEIRNTLDRPVTGQAVPSYGPPDALQYFRKLECFCFRQQTLAAGEVRRMPVVFVIDPKLPKEINTITLSYTFFEVAGSKDTSG